MRIEIRDYTFDGKTYWVAVVDGAEVSTACTFMKALGVAIDAILEAKTAKQQPDPAYIAREYHHKDLPLGWTAWTVHPKGYVVLDAAGALIEDNFDSEQALLDYIEYLRLPADDTPSP